MVLDGDVSSEDILTYYRENKNAINLMEDGGEIPSDILRYLFVNGDTGLFEELSGDLTPQEHASVLRYLKTK